MIEQNEETSTSPEDAPEAFEDVDAPMADGAGLDVADEAPAADVELEAEVPGEAAADPLLACALVGMGITSLSMAAAAVRPVGARLASVNMDLCEDAAEIALAASDPMAARQAVLEALGH